jgi:hypothetical protein
VLLGICRSHANLAANWWELQIHHTRVCRVFRYRQLRQTYGRVAILAVALIAFGVLLIAIALLLE